MESIWVNRIRSGALDLTLEIEGYRPANLTFDAPTLKVARIEATLELLQPISPVLTDLHIPLRKLSYYLKQRGNRISNRVSWGKL